jgi:hypothetical protein
MVMIGVTGHRFLAETDKIAAGLEGCVSVLESSFPCHWTVASALADGADRLVTARLLAREGTRLVVFLPLALRAYETDFTTATAVAEFRTLLARADEVTELPVQRSRQDAYRAAGEAIVSRADLLIAVWDGQPGHGVGGTGAIVAAARARRIPLAWIHAGNRIPGTQEATTLGAEQGTVTFEDFPDEVGGT